LISLEVPDEHGPDQKKLEQFAGKAKETWGRLTDGDWKVVEGKRDQLVGKIQERYGIAREEAERRVSEFERNRGHRAPWSRG
jgi:uncharacterized protein YjbJ (UPF0337 family)